MKGQFESSYKSYTYLPDAKINSKEYGWTKWYHLGYARIVYNFYSTYGKQIIIPQSIYIIMFVAHDKSEFIGMIKLRICDERLYWIIQVNPD